MQLGDLTKPGEKKKLAAAGVLGLVAILFLWWTFVGFGSSARPATRPSPTPTPAGTRAARDRDQDKEKEDALKRSFMVEIAYEPSSQIAPAPQRNIFAYFVPIPKPSPVVPVATPTPTPPPPLLLQAVSPSSVYARTGDFNLDATGDKFTPAMRIYVDQREMPTKYKSPQQLSTTIPAAMIVAPGPHNVIVRLPSDTAVFSNQQSFNVGAPPVPNYSFIGLVSSPTRVDIAYLQDKGSKDVLTVQRGDVLSGRFRVTSISDKEVVFVDTSLKIRHNVARSEGERQAGSPLMRPTPRVDAEDDEP
jgi:hypothetical protein